MQKSVSTLALQLILTASLTAGQSVLAAENDGSMDQIWTDTNAAPAKTAVTTAPEGGQAASAPLCPLSAIKESELVRSGGWPGIGPFKGTGTELIDADQNKLKLETARDEVTAAELHVTAPPKGFINLEMSADFLLESLGAKASKIADFNTQLDKEKMRLLSSTSQNPVNLSAGRYLVDIHADEAAPAQSPEEAKRHAFVIRVSSKDASAEVIKRHSTGRTSQEAPPSTAETTIASSAKTAVQPAQSDKEPETAAPPARVAEVSPPATVAELSPPAKVKKPRKERHKQPATAAESPPDLAASPPPTPAADKPATTTPPPAETPQKTASRTEQDGPAGSLMGESTPATETTTKTATAPKLENGWETGPETPAKPQTDFTITKPSEVKPSDSKRTQIASSVLPSVTQSPSHTDGSASQSLKDQFQSIIEGWQKVKRTAVKDRNVADLSLVLAGKTLARQTDAIKWLTTNHKYYDMTPKGVVVNKYTPVIRDQKYLVAAQVREDSKFMDEATNQVLKETDDTYNVNYTIERVGSKWMITDSAIVNTTTNPKTTKGTANKTTQ